MLHLKSVLGLPILVQAVCSGRCHLDLPLNVTEVCRHVTFEVTSQPANSVLFCNSFLESSGQLMGDFCEFGYFFGDYDCNAPSYLPSGMTVSSLLMLACSMHESSGPDALSGTP